MSSIAKTYTEQDCKRLITWTLYDGNLYDGKEYSFIKSILKRPVSSVPYDISGGPIPIILSFLDYKTQKIVCRVFTDWRMHMPHQTYRRCKARLILGDGNFSYTLAMLEKHPEMIRLPQSITTSEIITAFIGSTNTRIKEIQRLGATVLRGIDATKLDTHFKGKKFKRIHWNCPYLGGSYELGLTRDALVDFFRSASKVLARGGEIHLALAQPLGDEKFYQGTLYGIVQASSHFKLVKTRPFSNVRFPGYVHERTWKRGQSARAASRLIEFIFKRESEIYCLDGTIDVYEGPRDDPQSSHFLVYKDDLNQDSSDYEDSSDSEEHVS